MKRARIFITIALMAFAAGCGFFEFNDVEQVQTCCDCLSENQRPKTDAGVGTYDVSNGELSVCINGSEDCLCGESADSCFRKLTEERAPIPILGACAASGGPCEPACRRVLIFEPVSSGE